MAKIVVENATVERVFTTSSGIVGAVAWETYTPKGGGEAKKTWFTLWFAGDVSLMKGQVISASGLASARLSERNGSHYADQHVSFARLIDSAPPIAPEPSTDDLAWAQEPPAEDDAWASSDGWGA